MDKQSLELLLGQGLSIQRIATRFGKDPSTVSYWVRKHGLSSPFAEKHAPKGGIARERLEELVEAGMTIAQISAEVGLSKGTVAHWLRSYALRTHHAPGMRPTAARAARDAGLLTITRICLRHGDTQFTLEGRGYYRCKRCRAERVARRRRDIKTILVREAGGSCQLCGYDRWIGALQFHHVDRSGKRFGIALGGVSRSLERAREEAAKCVLLCANCHAEVEHGDAELSLQFPA